MDKFWTSKSALKNGSKEANQYYKTISSDLNICMKSEYSFYCYTLDVRVNSVAHRVPWWRIRLWPDKCVFYDMILHQAGMHVRGMFGYVWHDCRN